jgi:hypothetical protein
MNDPAEARRPAAGSPPDTAAPGGSSTASGGIELVGEFSPAEREYLSRQFSRCRVELLRRAARDSSLAVIAWHATGDTFSRSGPGPLLGTAMPRRAVYVLQAPDTTPGAAPGGGRLVRIRTQLDLQDQIGERVERLDLGGASSGIGSAWESARRALRGLAPWHTGR